jgi:NhaP-type Na+/H+ or K+/H+ antiporter
MKKEKEEVRVTLPALAVSALVIVTIALILIRLGVWYLCFLLYWEVKEWIYYLRSCLRQE